MSSPNKVLTINFGGIGDEVLFLPALATLKQLLPDSRVTLLVEPRSKSVSEVTDLIDQVITFDIKKRPLTPMDLFQLTNLLRAGRYDIVVSSGSSPMVAMLLFLSGIPLRIGYDSGRPWNSLLTHPVKLLRDQYAADMYHDLTKGVANYLRRKYHPNGSIRVDETKSHMPVITLKDQSLSQMKTFLEEGAQACWGEEATTSGGTGPNNQIKPIKYVLLHPGTSRMAISKGIIKTWSNENWLTYIELLQNGSTQEPASTRTFDVRIVLAGGPDDKEVIADLEAALKAKNIRYISAAGKTRGLADLAALTSLCHLLVCVDSAPMHIGVGLNKKMVALFGPTEPQKLIPDTPQFKVLADRPESPAPPRTLLDGLGVRLHPESVYQSSLDLLKAD